MIATSDGSHVGEIWRLRVILSHPFFIGDGLNEGGLSQSPGGSTIWFEEFKGEIQLCQPAFEKHFAPNEFKVPGLVHFTIIIHQHFFELHNVIPYIRFWNTVNDAR